MSGAEKRKRSNGCADFEMRAGRRPRAAAAKTEQADEFGVVLEGVLAEDFEDVGKQRDSGAEEDEADDVERIGALFAIVGQVAIDEVETDEADRNVDEKNEAPVEIADDKAAGDGAEHRADQAGDGDEAHRANEFGFRERADHRQATDGNHHGAATALQNAEGDEDVDVGGEAAEQRAEREDADGGGKTRRVPKRSAIQPLMGMKTARLSV